MWRILFAGLSLGLILVSAKGYEAGVARVEITPQTSIWMSGYGNRNKPSTGVTHALWAKALAIRDEKNQGVVIVTTDLIGLPRVMTDTVSARVEQQFHVPRSRLLFNSSHTHTGPYVRANLITMFDLPEEERQKIKDYAQQLTEHLVTVIGAALGQMEPVDLSFANGTASFAINRREWKNGRVIIGVNPQGPVDQRVPVLRVVSKRTGRAKAILTGYACHNTTLTGDFYELSGDYSGFAQIELEKANPGAVAMFLMLCGGDANPNPRSTMALAQQHGQELAQSVQKVLSGSMTPVTGPVRAAYEQTRLNFAPHTRDDFTAELKHRNAANVRRAQYMLEKYDAGEPVRQTPYPVQAVRFGTSLTFLALGGEVVVDYANRARQEFPKENLVVVGYSNDVMCYIPSKRVLQEGGYEAVDSMVYYGQPGPFTDDVEESVFAAIRRVMQRVQK
jgi:hypothetical protein